MKTKLTSADHVKPDEKIENISIFSYPELDVGKPLYFDNTDIPWVESPKLQDRPAELAEALAHEMRSPLAVIYVSSQLLMNVLEKDNQLRIHVDMILNSAARINDLLVRFLTNPHAEETTGIYSIKEILNEVLDLVADRIMLKSITVIKDIKTADFKATLNKLEMKIALTNIIINAIDAMPLADGILRLSLKENNGSHAVTIEDNGCGISRKNVPSIFNKGFTNKQDGTGFGLSIANGFLQANNVTIKVKSEEGKGTIFLLLFN